MPPCATWSSAVPTPDDRAGDDRALEAANLLNRLVSDNRDQQDRVSIATVRIRDISDLLAQMERLAREGSATKPHSSLTTGLAPSRS